MKALKQKFAPASMSMLALVMCAVMIVAPIGCAKVQQTLKTVLAKAPTVIAIVNTGLDLYNIIDPTGADPGLKATIDSIAQGAVSDINLLVQTLAQYQADVASAPPGALAAAHQLYLSIDSRMAQFTAAFHLKSARAQAEAAAIVDATDIFLSELASLLPASAAAAVAPAAGQAVASGALIKTQAALTGSKVKIISPKTFASNFNKASKANFPQIQVATP